MKMVTHNTYTQITPQILAAVDQFDHTGEVLYRGRNTVKVMLINGERFNFKRFKKPNLINKLIYRFVRKSKAQRSYEYANILTDLGIGTPEPVAYIEDLQLITLGYSYYISRQLDCDFTFRELINNDQITDKSKVLIEFARFMYHLHEAGVYFLDHSPGNTLISRVGDQCQFALVDLNRMKFYDIPWQDRLKNFERLSPQRWMYEVMGQEYATLSRKRPKETIEQMWKYTQDFQQAFHRKRALKKKLKSIIGLR